MRKQNIEKRNAAGVWLLLLLTACCQHSNSSPTLDVKLIGTWRSFGDPKELMVIGNGYIVSTRDGSPYALVSYDTPTRSVLRFVQKDDESNKKMTYECYYNISKDLTSLTISGDELPTLTKDRLFIRQGRVLDWQR
jgi:hypothetical protein